MNTKENTKSWNLKCPKCNKNRTFSTRKSLNSSIKKQTVCNSCSKKEENNPNYKNGSKIMGNLNPMFGKFGVDHPAYGHKCSNEIKQKLKDLSKKKQKLKYRQKLSSLLMGKNKGKIHSEEAKRKMRIAKLKRLELLNIGTGEDRGAKEWFSKYNKENNTNFQPKRFMEIGYIADGYDENKHIWVEYDTPYHKPLYRQRKDSIRQNNIIKYFERIGNPLNSFIRVKIDNFETSPATRCIYGK